MPPSNTLPRRDAVFGVKCDWCRQEVDAVYPVLLARDTHVDGGVGELIEDGYSPLTFNPEPTMGQACAVCLETGAYRALSPNQREGREARRDRAERAARRILYG